MPEPTEEDYDSAYLRARYAHADGTELWLTMQRGHVTPPALLVHRPQVGYVQLDRVLEDSEVVKRPSRADRDPSYYEEEEE